MEEERWQKILMVEEFYPSNHRYPPMQAEQCHVCQKLHDRIQNIRKKDKDVIFQYVSLGFPGLLSDFDDFAADIDIVIAFDLFNIESGAFD